MNQDQNRSGEDGGVDPPRSAQGRVDTNREQIKEFLQVLSAQAERALRGLEYPGFLQISRLHPTDKKLVPTLYKSTT